jgi:signal transduction histidine kinase
MRFVKRPRSRMCIVILGAILVLQSAFAVATPFLFGDEDFRKHLGAHVEVLEDPSGTLTLEDVLSVPFKDRFAYDDNAELYYGFSQSAYWIRFTVENTSRHERTVYLQIAYPLLESVSLFEPTEKEYIRHVAGSLQKLSKQEIKGYDFVFPLVVPGSGVNTYYLRIKSNSTLTIPLFLSTKIKYFEYLQINLLKLGIYYGIIIGLMIYNFFIFLAVKDISGIRRESYLYYVVFLFATATFSACIDGISKFILPEWINWVRLTHFSVDLMLVASAQFSRSFLDSKNNTPILDKILLALVFAGVGLALFSSLGGMHRVGFITVNAVGPSAVIMILAGIVSWRKGYRPARYFMWAWISWLALAALYALSAIGLLEFNQPTAQYLVKIGTVFQLLLLSFALGDRINLLHRLLNQEVTERKGAQNQLMLLNEDLEDRVRQRTKELRHSNRELQDTMSELKQAQNYLVESEKMASLGQLVAGVAHEINTPIGVAVTAASHLQERTEKTNLKFEDGSLRRNDMTGYIGVSQESTKMILGNLQRASSLIKNFKQVAVDQSGRNPPSAPGIPRGWIARSRGRHGYIPVGLTPASMPPTPLPRATQPLAARATGYARSSPV